MGKGVLSKVMKYELTYIDGCGDFSNMQKELWALQRQTREILNRTIQMRFHWDYMVREHFKKTGKHLSIQELCIQEGTCFNGNSIDGYIYNVLSKEYTNLSTKNLTSTIRVSSSKYTSDKEDVNKGQKSIPSFKSDQPLTLNANCVKISESPNNPQVQLTVFSNPFKKEHGYGNLRFALHLQDATQRSIFVNILSGIYRLGDCKLIYKKPKWFLSLTYNFIPEVHSLDPTKTLGVDLGETIALYASSVGEYGSLRLEGGEVTAFAAKLEARKRSLQKQAACCGNGRKGHGTKTRVADAYKAEDKIANFRDTINHRYSRALIDYAVKNQYGTIQMEGLSGIKLDTGFPKFLLHWTYYDLQQKIENKAKEAGIRIVKVDPSYTSQRCSRCGHIDSNNRKTQAEFCCTKCGFKANADFNASQNLSIPGIDKIIKETLSANRE